MSDDRSGPQHQYFWIWSAAADAAEKLNRGEVPHSSAGPARGGAGLEPGWVLERNESGEWVVRGVGD